MKATEEAYDRAKEIEGEMEALSISLKNINTEIDNFKKYKANMEAQLKLWQENEKEQTPKAMKALEKNAKIVIATWDRFIAESHSAGQEMAERYAELINALDDIYDHHGL
ncbi:hypothetical protein [Aequorivita echinoideorum]|uniref:Uncharacterized protein n=1 Tax=Aequorivita echinoideorum TaxID=1549647 RepID=A0ABS5S365_9FLAO|nr:hypothetical protein [Aequorivita echinoideorum]MBT0607656.1 hypothetical protein [Aequorivita echinoideorum]